RRRRVLVPSAGFEKVAQELLVEAGLRTPWRVLVGGPVARRVRCQRLVDQDHLPLDRAELELGVGEDKATLARMPRGSPIKLQAEPLQLERAFAAEHRRQLPTRDVLVMARLG